jgi:hypothetical protein
MAFGSFSVGANPGEPAILSKGSNPGGGLSGPLSFGEKCALAQQQANRATNMSWAEHEVARIRSISVDAALKKPRLYGPR